MAFTRLKTNKQGQRFYEILVSRGRGKSYLSKRWYVPDGWSKKAIDRELAKQAADFEREVKEGNVVSRKEAAEIKAKQEAEAAAIYTVKDYGEKVFMPLLSIKAENTRSSFQSNLDLHVYPVIGSKKMPDVTANDIDALLTNFQASGKSYASCIKLYTILNMMFRRAYRKQVITTSIMEFVDRPQRTKAEGKDDEVQSFSEDELLYIIECLDKEVEAAKASVRSEKGVYRVVQAKKWRAYTRLLIDTGCRRGEALALRWYNIDFDNGVVTIEESLNYTPKRGVYSEKPKSGKSRKVYPSAEVMALLQEIKDESTSKAVVDISAARDGYVFTQEDGKTPLHPQSPTRYYKKLGDKYGIEDFHPHKLRHSFASVSIKAGADIASVSETLGHGDKATTLSMYTHSDAEAQRRTNDTFNEALRKAKKA